MQPISPTFTPLHQRRLGRLTVAWAVVFAVVHAYWAAGGEVGMNGNPADAAGEQIYIGAIALIGLLSAAVALGLTHGRRELAPVARAGGAALFLGVAFGAGRWLVHGSLDGDGAGGVVTTLYFLLGGVLFSALGRRSARLRTAYSRRRRPAPSPS